MPEADPIQEVLQMMQQGMQRQAIISSLVQKGYSAQKINNALNHASIKQGVIGNKEGGNITEEEAPTNDMQVSELDMQEEVPVPSPEQGYPEPMQEASPYPVAPNVPSSSQYQQFASPQPQYSYEEIQSLVEEVIDERWKEFLSTMGDVSVWRSQMSDEQEAIKQEVLRMQSRIDNLQSAVLGKVAEYSTGVKEIGLEMQALEKVFEKILEPLSSNIKELNKITETLRKTVK